MNISCNANIIIIILAVLIVLYGLSNRISIVDKPIDSKLRTDDQFQTLNCHALSSLVQPISRYEFYSSLTHSNSSNNLHLFPIPKLVSHALDYDKSIYSILSLTVDFTISITSNFSSKLFELEPLLSLCDESQSLINSNLSFNIHFIKGVHFTRLVEFSTTTMEYEPEYYELLINKSDTIVVATSTLEGAINALSTVNQLLHHGQILRLPVLIQDWPDNSWRGIMIDVSRHFIPMPLLFRLIDGMAISKMNRLHLHLTDAQSFPILLDDVEIKSNHSSIWLPLSNLSIQSAFSRDKIYTKQNLRDLVDYADRNGIEVVPEIDVPAHTLSWSHAFPDILLRCRVSASRSQTPNNIFPLDPSHPMTYIIIREVLHQMFQIFTSKYFHVGGDEVDESCWFESERVRNWSRSMGLKSSQSITKYFMFQVFEIVEQSQRVPIVWQGIIDSDALPNSHDNQSMAVIEPWKCWGGLALRAATKAAAHHHPVVMSACWYLDYNTDWMTYLATNINLLAQSHHHQSAHRRTASSYQTEEPWLASGKDCNTQTHQYVIPVTNGHIHCNLKTTDEGKHSRRQRNLEQDLPSSFIPLKQSSNFLGGEGAMWTECVDATNFECRVWPRVGAIASRLWGFNEQTLTDPKEKTSEHNSMPTSNFSSIHTSSSSSQKFTLNVNQLKNLYSSFVSYRFLLVRRLNIQAASIVFHIPHHNLHTKGGKGIQWYAKEMTSEWEALTFIQSQLKDGLTFPSRGDLSTNPVGIFRITSLCLGIPEKIQRPLYHPVLTLAQLNVAEGSIGKRGELMLRWLQQRAQEGTIAVGLCELNGWQEMQSHVEIMKNKAKIVFKAAEAGYPYSYIMVHTNQPYHIGLMAAVPFEVVGEYGPPEFRRGLLHVFFHQMELHVMIAHLHAHDSHQREVEAHRIAQIIQKLNGQRIVLMGDLNTLSPHDNRHHVDMDLLGMLTRGTGTVYQRLRKKFLNSDNSCINYEPMNILLRSGLHDACVIRCTQWSHASSDHETLSNGTIHNQMELYPECMKSNCSFSEPTLYNPEWTERDSSPPKIRLDYILLSDSLLHSPWNSSKLLKEMIQSLEITLHDASRGNASGGGFQSYIDATQLTSTISDHYPVVVSIPDDHSIIQSIVNLLNKSSHGTLRQPTTLWLTFIQQLKKSIKAKGEVAKHSNYRSIDIQSIVCNNYTNYNMIEYNNRSIVSKNRLDLEVQLMIMNCCSYGRCALTRLY